MPLLHRSSTANEVRAPEVPRGEAVIVGRYGKDKPKVALLNPEDLTMLEDAYDMLRTVGTLQKIDVDDLTRKALRIEDRPDEHSVEDPDEIAAILGL